MMTIKTFHRLLDFSRYQPRIPGSNSLRSNCQSISIVFLIALCSVSPAIAADDDGLSDVYYQSGLGLIKTGSYADAIAKFNEALTYRPDFPEALYKLGECYEKIKEPAKAINNYRLCAACLQQLAERSKEQNEILADVAKRMDKLDVNGKALNNIKKSYTDKLLALARDCISKKYNRFAMRIIEHILQIDPGNKAAQELSAKLTGLSDKPKAVEDKKKAPPEVKPKEAGQADRRMGKSYLDKCDSYLAKGDYERALVALADAVKADPKSVEGFVNARPGSESAKRSIDNVLADLNEKIALNPQYYSVYYVRSVLNAKMGNYRSAVTDANIALKLAPKDPFAPELKKLLPKWQDRAK